jgi:hypothetical protein
LRKDDEDWSFECVDQYTDHRKGASLRFFGAISYWGESACCIFEENLTEEVSD